VSPKAVRLGLRLRLHERRLRVALGLDDPRLRRGSAGVAARTRLAAPAVAGQMALIHLIDNQCTTLQDSIEKQLATQMENMGFIAAR